jgi:bifunctional non-homologous end joining protein LigD
VGDRLDEYRRKRSADRTPEPVPAGPLPQGEDDTFVIQQHHARALHWDLRLERGGVLVSWAVPRGVPRDPARNHLAVHTEDHPLEYAEFEGEIPAGEYGGGRMKIYDRGTYATEKWRDDEVIVTFSGSRVSGRYVLFQTRGKDWMIHRMDPPEPGWTPMPEQIRPMVATAAARLPADDDAWAYELAWDGVRALAAVDGGRLRLTAADETGRDAKAGGGITDITGPYPQLRAMAESLAPTECLLDGVVVAFEDGRVSRAALDARLRAPDTASGRRAAARTPVQYLVFDLLWLDGADTTGLSYVERRELLGGLDLAGTHWQTPPHFTGGGKFALRTAREQGLPGVVAKRLDAPYTPGRRTRKWLSVRA